MAEPVSSIGLVALLAAGLWLAASLAFQLSSFQTALGRLDRLSLLPSWSFFAPHPAYRDNHLLVRYVSAGGQVGRWQPAASFASRTLLDALWNPSKRPRKVLRDASKSVRHTMAHCRSRAVLHCSLAYLILLNFSIRAGRPPQGALLVQFAIVESSGREQRRLWISFISDLHRL